MDTLTVESLKMDLEINSTKINTMIFTRGSHKGMTHINIRHVTLQGEQNYTNLNREVKNRLDQYKEIRTN